MLSDCIKCYDTPCTCGYKYQSWSTKNIQDLIKVLQNVLAARTEKTDEDK